MGAVVLGRVDPPGLRCLPLPASKNILVLEENPGQARVYAGSLIRALERENRLLFSSPGEALPGNEFGLRLAPLSWAVDGATPTLRYEVFPAGREATGFNCFFPFDRAIFSFFQEAMLAHAVEMARTPYQVAAAFSARYFGRLRSWPGRDSRRPFCHPFLVRRLVVRGGSASLSTPSEMVAPPDILGRYLFFSPHSDDAEIAAGGLIRHLLTRGARVENWILTESHGQRERREKEARAAAAVLSRGAKSDLEVRFFGFPSRRLDQASTLEILESALKSFFAAGLPVGLFLPGLRDHHPTHRAVNALMMQLLERRCVRDEIEIPLFFYSAPWSGPFDAYFPCEKDWGEGCGARVARLLKQALGRGGLVGELCGEFGGASLVVPFVERFQRVNL